MSESAANVPELISAVYEEAPAPLRIRLLESLVRPLGPLALVAIAGGAFAHLLYRLRRNAAPISPNDANRVTSEQVLELTNYVEQCSPDALLRIGALIADHRTTRRPSINADASVGIVNRCANSWTTVRPARDTAMAGDSDRRFKDHQ